MRAARSHTNIWHYCPREHHLYEVLHWLAERDYFPTMSWQNVKVNAIAKVREKRTNGKKLEAEISAKLGRKTFWCKSPDDRVETLEWMIEAKLNKVDFRPSLGWSGWVNFGDQKAVRIWEERKAAQKPFPIGREIFKPMLHLSMLEWMVNWNMSDRELVWFFSEALKRGRPKEFKEFAKKSQGQLSIVGAFPFRRSAALQWLGVLRRRCDVKTWREYMEFYNPSAIKSRKGAVVKSRDISSLASPREEDCRKAKLILDWFERGKPLHKKDFK